MKHRRSLLWIAAGPLAVLFAILAVAHQHLAITERVGSDVLVVEGWMEPHHLRLVPRWIDSLHYHTVYTTGTIRPFAYYLKAGEAIDVRLHQPLKGEVRIRVGGLPGAGFRLMTGADTLMQHALTATSDRYITVMGDAASDLRIESWNNGSMDQDENNLFIQSFRLGEENVHFLADTVIVQHADSTFTPGTRTYAHKCALDLRDLGVHVPIVALPAYGKPDSRSWANASYFGVKAKADGLASCDVITVGVHARRTRELFRRACPPGMGIGVISLDDPACPRKGWWKSWIGWVLMLKEIFGSSEPIAVDLTR